MVEEYLLPIGTIIEKNDQKLMIVGYQYIEISNSIEIAYCMVPYPLGFSDIKNIVVLKEIGDATVIYRGLEDNVLYHEYVDNKRQICKELKKYNIQDVENTIGIIAQSMQEEF